MVTSPVQVLKLCTYLASSPSATRVSKRISLVEEYEEEQMRLRSRVGLAIWWVVSWSWRPANWWNSWWIIPGSKWLVKEIWAVWQGNNPSQGTNKKPWLQTTSSWQPSPGNFGSFHAPCVTGAGLTGLPKNTAQNTGNLHYFSSDNTLTMWTSWQDVWFCMASLNNMSFTQSYLHTPIGLIIQKFIYIYIISFQYICVVNFKGQPTLPPPLVSWPHPRPWRRMALPRKKELDLNGFLALRANSGFMEGAAQVAGLWGGDDDSEKSRWGCHNGCIYSLRLETFFFF